METAHKRREPIDLTQGPCWKVILLFSLPVILSYLLQQVYSISDAAIVGQTLTAAIGQSYDLFTPLQLANYIATLWAAASTMRPIC